MKPLTSIKQLDTLQIDTNSPRFQKAMQNLGFTKENLKPTTIEVVDDITQLRYEHFQNKLMNTINRIIVGKNTE